MTKTKPLFNGLQILQSANGFYIGLSKSDGTAYSRESEEYYETIEDAEFALASGTWPARNGVGAAPQHISSAMRAAAMIRRPETQARAYTLVRQMMIEAGYGPTITPTTTNESD